MQEVIYRFREGDEQAFGVIFNTYWKRLFAAAYRRLGDEQLAEDITQEVFMKLWDRKEALRLSGENLEFYLLKSVKNRVINHFSSSKVKKAVLERVIHRMEGIQSEVYDLKG